MSMFVHQDFQLNRVVLEEGVGAEPSPSGARPKKKDIKTYDLTAADKFWQKHKGRSVLTSSSLAVVQPLSDFTDFFTARVASVHERHPGRSVTLNICNILPGHV